ncbi:MAG: site-specific integrase [Nitrospira sp.]|nr:site-specific integrase [Nitrospira sp.]
MSTFLPRKRTSFYTRVVIPGRVRSYFKDRREVWKSLRTSDRAEAECRSLEWQAQGKRIFRTLRLHGDHMTKRQIETLVSRWLDDALDESEDARAIRPLNGDAIEDLQGGMSYHFDGYQEALVSGDYRGVTKEADELLQAAGLPLLDHASLDFAKLCRRLLRAKIEYLRIEYDRWEGEYRDDHLKGRGRVEDKSEVTEVPPSLPFTVVLDKYLVANPRPARTADPLKAEFGRFLELLGGDRPIATITRAECVRYKESLQANRKLSLITCIKHLSNLNTMLKWASNHDYLPAGFPSPAQGLGPSKRQAKKQAVKRRPFTTEELLTVLGSREFLAQKTDQPERYWVVLLLLFQGCRREEAAQLYHKNLLEVDGTWVINITDEEPDQTLRYPESNRRKVPLHSALVKLGFLWYVQSIKKTGHPRIFPQLTRKGNNGYADPIGKWFGRLVTGVGLTDPRLVIHSFRRGMITALHSAGVPVNIAEVITGHSAGTVHAEYVHKELISMKTLQDALEKVQFPEVVKLLSIVRFEDV